MKWKIGIMAKTSSGLVSLCKSALNGGTGYVFGTIGQICTEALLDQMARDHPGSEEAGGAMRTIGEKWV